MKRIFLIPLLVFGLTLSWNMACFGDFYVIPIKKKNFSPVEKTGQSSSYATGDDGELYEGVVWPNPRFEDNGDGTVTDNLTGLMWLKNANCIQTNYPGFDTDATNGDGMVTWQHALDFVAGINAGAYTACGSTYTDWRLPNVKELQSLIDYGQYNPALPSGYTSIFTNVLSSSYWSSTTYAPYPNNAWHVGFNGGLVLYSVKSYYHSVWSVRGSN